MCKVHSVYFSERSDRYLENLDAKLVVHETRWRHHTERFALIARLVTCSPAQSSNMAVPLRLQILMHGRYGEVLLWSCL